MTRFDAYLFVDWSARSAPSPATPSADAIWVAEAGPVGEPREAYLRTRDEATAHVRRRLLALVRDGRRVLAGFDFPYGYPAGLAACLGRGGARPWRAVWDHLSALVADVEGNNKNNRFAAADLLNRRIGDGPGPFWGCPAGRATAHLTTGTIGNVTFPYVAGAGVLQRLRRTEQATPGVQETWKLMGAGSVGGQALLGIPRVRALRDDPALAAASEVWPFETGFSPTPGRAEGPSILHAEIWPGIVPAAQVAQEVAATGAIRDRAQVRLMCRWARDHDRAGTLGGWFDATGLDEATRRAAVEEEGWILGCPA